MPHKYGGKLFLVDKDNYMEAAESIRNHTYPIISLNESSTEDFDTVKSTIHRALEEILPDKSGFEK